MKIPREEEPSSAIINMSSLLDVMFILLIFFMATTTFEQAEHDRKVNLTKDSNKRTTIGSDTKTLIINVRKSQGQAFYTVRGLKMDLAQIKKEVKDNLAQDANYKVIVRGDEWAFHGHVAKAISECQSAGVKEVNLAYMTSTIGEE